MDNQYYPYLIEILDFTEKNLKDRQLVMQSFEAITKECPWFPTVFSVVIGKKFEDYLLGRVLSDSAKYLFDSSKTVTDIAKEYKFSSQQTYSTSFASIIGVPPHVFRAENPTEKLIHPFVFDNKLFDSSLMASITVGELPPMKVASCRLYKSNSRQSKIKVSKDVLESKAWSKMIGWQMTFAYFNLLGFTGKNPGIGKLSKMMVKGGYHLPPLSRFFGFVTTFSGNEVGYEAWSLLSAKNHEYVSNDKEIVIKEFEGGEYAIIDVPEGVDEKELTKYWKCIHKWILENKEYTYGDHQYLEEYITVPNKGGFHGKKLYMPIKKIK